MDVLQRVAQSKDLVRCPDLCSPDSSRRVEVARHLGLDWQADHQDFLGRIAAAERTGMTRVSLEQVVALMTKKRVREISTDGDDASHQVPFDNPWAKKAGVFGNLLRRCGSPRSDGRRFARRFLRSNGNWIDLQPRLRTNGCQRPRRRGALRHRSVALTRLGEPPG